MYASGSTLLQSLYFAYYMPLHSVISVGVYCFAFSLLTSLIQFFVSFRLVLFRKFRFRRNCAEMLRPRDQNFGFGLEAVASVSALSIWPRPGLGLLVPLPIFPLVFLGLPFTDWLIGDYTSELTHPCCTQPKCTVKLWMCHYSSDKRCADFSLKIHQKRLAAGLRPDPMGELTTLPRPLSWI